MAQAYYNVEKAAEVLGVTPDEVRLMRERQELYGYRDGANWKFKAEDVDRLAAQRTGEADDDEGQGDVLLSDQELGSSPGASGSVIGSGVGSRRGASDSHVIGDSTPGSTVGGPPAKPEASDEYDLVLESSSDSLALGEDAAAPAAKGKEAPKAKAAPKGKSPGKGKPPAASASDSTLDLSANEDDLVLGGSSGGSDVTIGGDSGISLVDPADSGLSLEQPLELGGSTAEESLELGEEDMLATAADEPASKPPSDLKTDDDFLLTPLAEGADEDDSSSGSQVIALDTDGAGNEGATMVGGPATASMVAMLDEDIGSAAPLGTLATEGVGAGLHEPALGPTAEELAAYAALPEAPYSGWNIAALTLCVLILGVCGSMMFDLIRNMWSWDQAWNVNSSTMDWIVGLFEKK